jgi:hypothetical protein
LAHATDLGLCVFVGLFDVEADLMSHACDVFAHECDFHFAFGELFAGDSGYLLGFFFEFVF